MFDMHCGWLLEDVPSSKVARGYEISVAPVQEALPMAAKAFDQT